MTAPIQLIDLVSLRICPACNGSGCRACCGRGRVPLDPYRPGGGEQGEDYADVRPAARMVPTFVLERMAALARVVRDPSNPEPLVELLDLLEEVTRG